MDLSGQWSYKLDTADVGISENWQSLKFTNKLKLPGSLNENNIGFDVTVDTHWTGNMWNDSLWYTDPKMEKYRQEGNIKIPFWLQPNKTYKGAAWYQKEVEIPQDWENSTINLHLERVHWEATLWIDDKQVAMKNTLATPQNFEIENLTPGKHTITLRIDNRVKDIDPGLDAHSISDNTQTNWNGVVGNIQLSAVPKLAIKNIIVHPNINDKSIEVHLKINNQTDINNAEIRLLASENFGAKKELNSINQKINVDKDIVKITYNLGNDAKLWDEFNPNTYTLNVELISKAGTQNKTTTFGLREFKAVDKQFAINGRTTFLRGTLECAIFPKTGYPPTNVDDWKKIYKTIKAHGLNHIRFHSWCPPKAAFIAADEEGVFLQVEASSWATIGDGKPIDRWIYKEAEAIIDAYGNHPSFVMMAYGNEPHGTKYTEYLKEFIIHFKKYDDRRLYAAAAGWTYVEEMDYFNNFTARIQRWNEQLNSIINAKPPQTVFDFQEIIDNTKMPYVSHEIGQWCVYPNFKEMDKYSGVLKPKNFEIFKETLAENGLSEYAEDFLMASGKLQTLCYKADIEAALRTKNMAGFQLLDLHDFPGQGTALVGVLDAFWEEKGYVSPEEFSQFCNTTVPLARLEKRSFRNNETLKASFEIAHFGKTTLKNVVPKWKLIKNDGSLFKEGTLSQANINIGNGIPLGNINVDLSEIKKAEKLTLSVTVQDFKNTWDIWVYPSELPILNKEKIKVVHKIDANTSEFLEKGGKVLLSINKGSIKEEKGGNIAVGFSSIFWNTSWTNGQKPHTLGILCDPKHLALADFPTEYHSNWQWWDAMSNSNAIIIDDFNGVKPIVRVIDDWFKNRNTALIFEVAVGKGKLIVSGIDLHTNLENRIEAKQLKYSLENYMLSDAFQPNVKTYINRIKNLFKTN